jgi:hypothetical protein
MPEQINLNNQGQSLQNKPLNQKEKSLQNKLKQIVAQKNLVIRIEIQELQDFSIQDYDEELEKIENQLEFSLSQELKIYQKTYGFSIIMIKDKYTRAEFRFWREDKNCQYTDDIGEVYCPATNMSGYSLIVNNNIYACIANTAGSDDILMNKEGNILFRARQDSQVVDLKKNQIYKVADSFFEFLEMLY